MLGFVAFEFDSAAPVAELIRNSADRRSNRVGVIRRRAAFVRACVDGPNPLFELRSARTTSATDTTLREKRVDPAVVQSFRSLNSIVAIAEPQCDCRVQEVSVANPTARLFLSR